MALEMEQLLQEAQDAAEEAEINETNEQDPNIKTNDLKTAEGNCISDKKSLNHSLHGINVIFL